MFGGKLQMEMVDFLLGGSNQDPFLDNSCC